MPSCGVFQICVAAYVCHVRVLGRNGINTAIVAIECERVTEPGLSSGTSFNDLE